jgi:hypothetical protein
MVASLTYRTNDVTRWGGGLGSDLSATQVDLNFWTLFSAVQALEDHTSVFGAGIDFINQPSGGNLFFIHLTDHRVLGPFVIPTAQWNPRGNWAPNTNYAAYDVVSNNGSAYLITIPHTSGSVFSALSTDGNGHLLYNLLLEQPANELPVSGTPGQRLVKSTSSPYTSEWLSDHIRLALFIGGKPNNGELVLQYAVSDNMTLPTGLIGSVFFANTEPSAPATFQINRNGAAIGTFTFEISPPGVAVAFSADIPCIAGDIITITAPSPQDVSLADISLSVVAALTL